MVIRLVPTDDGAKWNRLVDEVPGGTAFHSWDWLQLSSSHFGWRLHAFLVEQDGSAVGVFPVFVEQGFPPHSVRPPFPFVGPVVPPGVLAETLKALRRWQLTRALPRLRFEFAPGVEVAAAVESARCSWEPDSTFVIPIAGRTEEEIRKGMTRRGQRALKRAQAAGVEVRPSRPGEVADMLPRLFDEAWSARGLATPYPSTIAVDLDRRAMDDDDFIATTAVIEDVPVGVLVSLLHGDTVYCWGGGALRDYRDQQPFTAMAFDAFLWARAHDYGAVDMVGKVDAGVAAFKHAIGGIEIPYTIVASTIVPGPAVRMVGALRRTRAGEPSTEPSAGPDADEAAVAESR